MKYPYFRGLEADRYSFYRVPKALIKVDLFEKMSGDAKLLYAVLLDRMNLSLKNGWQDENGNAYIICTIDEIMDSIRCARQKAVKLLDELEHEYQLIERRRQGLGKPNLLYVKDLYAGLSESNYWKYENQTSGGLKSELPGVWKSNGSKTDINNTDSSETDLIYSAQSGENISGEMREDERYRFYFQDKLEIPILEKNFPHDREILMEILELLVETVTSRKKFLRICGEEKPKEVVKSRLMKLDSMHMQEQGLMSSLPLANNLVPIKRALTTTSTAIFVPFTTQELFMEGDSLYYGLNAVSNNMIMADRKQLKNPNGLILGTPGSGKSFSAKREMTNVFFTTTDDIIIADPEGEYYPLVEALGGQVIHISSTSRDYINPMDINLNYADDDNPLGMKSDFILSLCELIMGARDGMEPEEKSVIDRCLPLVYQKYLNDPKPENMPILGDLYDCLREQKERQAQRIATALEIYVNGSLRVFNHQTNVELDNRLICFDIKELGKQLKKLGMLIVQDQVWNRVTINRNAKKNTRYYIDEFHLLLKEEQTAAYSVEIWKRFRKWGGIPTGITQNIKDLLASREIENIFENSDFIYMLNQASGDRQILAKQLNISPFQLSYVTNSNEGEGLLFYGNTIIPFKDKFDTSLKLYGLMTTKPNEIAKYREKKDA